ncbi:MAG: CRISPR system precrRNA processing endoribonuclease RAMP protein Cas6 [Trichlorobacter sp.]|uniref:CRISPR system precrRNA processing endoribonuclease RAMP protein Cas6 n=1 Tax=Trichlorobacter sp. TaxID=2911007 RepID=UPI00256000CA|nr:CRISPR system precrRNA processing endoribonuclease RAMP protein Cas6 [Trichlorobacter sp.]MDK9718797.1 CRISPR system precrRNA processing endoribonuclease RAMP protein Cas6 [Trichlorobacter sp.]
MDLNIIKLHISLASQADSGLEPILTGKGAGFEDALRTVSCVHKNQSCTICQTSGTCVVPALIARHLSQDPDLVRRHQKPGLPFVFYAHSDVNDHDSTLGLNLLGSACGHLPLFLKALNTLTGQDACIRLTASDYQNVAVELDHVCPETADNLPVLAAADLLTLYSHRFSCCKRIRLDLLSPLRLKRDGHELSRFEPHYFIRSLLRRISSLAVYYGGGVNQELFRHLAQRATSVSLVRQLPSKSMGSLLRGVTGSFELAGPFDELGPFLALGEQVHLGKGAAFGMGSFVVTVIG